MIISAILKQNEIFWGIDEKRLEKISTLCQERSYGLGEIIFKGNIFGDELYTIIKGEVEILVDPALVSGEKHAKSEPQRIALFQRGQSFGEVALVDQGLRSASARSANPDTHVISIPRNELMQLCEQDTLLGFQLMRNLATDLATKLRGTDYQIRDQLLSLRQKKASASPKTK